MTARRSLGGAEHRQQDGGPGSSPGVSVKQLRNMLRRRDRLLRGWDRYWKHVGGGTNRKRLEQIDNERRLIRERIKRYAGATP